MLDEPNRLLLRQCGSREVFLVAETRMDELPNLALSWFTGVLAHFRLDWDWLFQFHSIESKVSIINPV